MTSNMIIPLEDLLDIVRKVVSKYRPHNHPDYGDFVQDVLLGIFERMPEYDPACSEAKKFVISVAYQKAMDRHIEDRRRRRIATTNHRSRVPYRVKLREVGEADRHGRLKYDDPDLRLCRIRESLDHEQLRFLELLRSGHEQVDIERKMNITSERCHEIARSLQNIFDSKTHSKKYF